MPGGQEGSDCIGFLGLRGIKRFATLGARSGFTTDDTATPETRTRKREDLNL
jgi:hypothetical protein